MIILKVSVTITLTSSGLESVLSPKVCSHSCLKLCPRLVHSHMLEKFRAHVKGPDLLARNIALVWGIPFPYKQDTQAISSLLIFFCA